MVLEDRKPSDISGAFKQWMKTKSSMPTPADILKIIKDEESFRRSMEPVKYDIQEPKKLAAPLNKMPWDGYKWEEMPENIRSELWRFCQGLWHETARQAYVRSFDVSYDEFTFWGDNEGRYAV